MRKISSQVVEMHHLSHSEASKLRLFILEFIAENSIYFTAHYFLPALRKPVDILHLVLAASHVEQRVSKMLQCLGCSLEEACCVVISKKVLFCVTIYLPVVLQQTVSNTIISALDTYFAKHSALI